MRITLDNKLPNQLKSLKNVQFSRQKLEPFLLQKTFYWVEEYFSHEVLAWKMYLYIKWGLILENWELKKQWTSVHSTCEKFH